ncbi:Glucose-6-phosphate isomerase [subsurface metagenome]
MPIKFYLNKVLSPAISALGGADRRDLTPIIDDDGFVWRVDSRGTAVGVNETRGVRKVIGKHGNIIEITSHKPGHPRMVKRVTLQNIKTNDEIILSSTPTEISKNLTFNFFSIRVNGIPLQCEDAGLKVFLSNDEYVIKDISAGESSGIGIGMTMANWVASHALRNDVSIIYGPDSRSHSLFHIMKSITKKPKVKGKDRWEELKKVDVYEQFGPLTVALKKGGKVEVEVSGGVVKKCKESPSFEGKSITIAEDGKTTMDGTVVGRLTYFDKLVMLRGAPDPINIVKEPSGAITRYKLKTQKITPSQPQKGRVDGTSPQLVASFWGKRFKEHPKKTAFRDAPLGENAILVLPAFLSLLVGSFIFGIPISLVLAGAWVGAASGILAFVYHKEVFERGKTEPRPATSVEKFNIFLHFLGMGMGSLLLATVIMHGLSSFELLQPGQEGFTARVCIFIMAALSGYLASAFYHSVVNIIQWVRGKPLLVGTRSSLFLGIGKIINKLPLFIYLRRIKGVVNLKGMKGKEKITKKRWREFISSRTFRNALDLNRQLVAEDRIGFESKAGGIFGDYAMKERKRIQEHIRHLKEDLGIKVLIHCGIGGQSFGNRALVESVGTEEGIEIIFLENLGYDYRQIFEEIIKDKGYKPHQIAVHVSSKSGITDETLINFLQTACRQLILRLSKEYYGNYRPAIRLDEMLRKKKDITKVHLEDLRLSEEEKKLLRESLERIILTTTVKRDGMRLENFVYDLATCNLSKEVLGNDEGIFLAHIPENIQGRFSERSASGDVTSCFAGRDIEKINQGAKEVLPVYKSDNTIINSAQKAGAELHLLNPDYIVVAFQASNMVASGSSLLQKFTESLGKDGCAALVIPCIGQKMLNKFASASWPGKVAFILVNVERDSKGKLDPLYMSSEKHPYFVYNQKNLSEEEDARRLQFFDTLIKWYGLFNAGEITADIHSEEYNRRNWQTQPYVEIGKRILTDKAGKLSREEKALQKRYRRMLKRVAKGPAHDLRAIFDKDNNRLTRKEIERLLPDEQLKTETPQPKKPITDKEFLSVLDEILKRRRKLKNVHSITEAKKIDEEVFELFEKIKDYGRGEQPEEIENVAKFLAKAIVVNLKNNNLIPLPYPYSPQEEVEVLGLWFKYILKPGGIPREDEVGTTGQHAVNQFLADGKKVGFSILIDEVTALSKIKRREIPVVNYGLANNYLVDLYPDEIRRLYLESWFEAFNELKRSCLVLRLKDFTTEHGRIQAFRLFGRVNELVEEMVERAGLHKRGKEGRPEEERAGKGARDERTSPFEEIDIDEIIERYRLLVNKISDRSKDTEGVYNRAYLIVLTVLAAYLAEQRGELTEELRKQFREGLLADLEKTQRDEPEKIDKALETLHKINMHTDNRKKSVANGLCKMVELAARKAFKEDYADVKLTTSGPSKNSLLRKYHRVAVSVLGEKLARKQFSRKTIQLAYFVLEAYYWDEKSVRERELVQKAQQKTLQIQNLLIALKNTNRQDIAEAKKILTDEIYIKIETKEKDSIVDRLWEMLDLAYQGKDPTQALLLSKDFEKWGPVNRRDRRKVAIDIIAEEFSTDKEMLVYLIEEMERPSFKGKVEDANKPKLYLQLRRLKYILDRIGARNRLPNKFPKKNKIGGLSTLNEALERIRLFDQEETTQTPGKSPEDSKRSKWREKMEEYRKRKLGRSVLPLVLVGALVAGTLLSIRDSIMGPISDLGASIGQPSKLSRFILLCVLLMGLPVLIVSAIKRVLNWWANIGKVDSEKTLSKKTDTKDSDESKKRPSRRLWSLLFGGFVISLIINSDVFGAVGDIIRNGPQARWGSTFEIPFGLGLWGLFICAVTGVGVWAIYREVGLATVGLMGEERVTLPKALSLDIVQRALAPLSGRGLEPVAAIAQQKQERIEGRMGWLGLEEEKLSKEEIKKTYMDGGSFLRAESRDYLDISY